MTGAAPLQSLPLADLDLTPDYSGKETAALQHSLPNNRPELNAESSSAPQDRSFANELVDGSSAKPTAAEAASLKSLALADLDLTSANEIMVPQRSASQAPNNAESRSGSGWWVILGSFNVDEGDSASGVKRATGAARRCGMDAFNDLSLKFRGFAPGYMVVVIGPFTDQVVAAKTRQQVNGCVSGTYVKYAQHLGE